MRDHGVWIDNDARVHGSDYAAHVHATLLVDLHFSDGRDEAAERDLDSDAAAVSRRKRAAPTAFLSRQFERRFEARGIFKEVASKVINLLGGAVWSDSTNCLITYRGLHWPDVIAALKVRDNALPTATAVRDKALYTLITAKKAG